MNLTKHLLPPRKTIIRGLVAAAAILSLVTATPSRADDGPVLPTVAYWHVWTDKDGVSHQSKEALRDFHLQSMEPPASPQWQDKLQAQGATIIVTVQPPGWQGEWHENPHRQWIIPLSGRWFVETMDGQRVEMGPGEVSFGEDQGTKPDAQRHKGHLSGTVGGEAAVLMIVQLPDVPTSEQPTHFK